MIYVRRDAGIIPKKVLDVAARAQAELETTPAVDRRAFIKKKSHIWRAFGRHLSKMSYGKCWYSESPDPQSFFDVDHFRPKLEAKRSDVEIDKPGYEWLAFSWENFRFAAGCSNRLSENDETGVVEGKGSWFPLLAKSLKASWDNRCESKEKPILLDPVSDSDVNLIEVKADGRMGQSRLAVGSAKLRVSESCKFYGLNLPGIKGARLKLMREVNQQLEVLVKSINAANDENMPNQLADMIPVVEQIKIIKAKTCSHSPYSKAARTALEQAGWAELCVKPEEEAAFLVA